MGTRLLRCAALMGVAVLADLPSAGQQSLDDLLKRGVVVPGKTVTPGTQQPPAPGAAGSAQPAATSSGGFRMDLPPGWRAGVGQNGAVVATGQAGLVVVIAPVLHAGGTTAGAWLPRAGAAEVSRYLRDPQFTGVYASRMGSGAALASFTYGGGEGAANALCLINGGVGTLYLIAGPQAGFLQQRPALVRILKSFSFTGESTSRQDPAQVLETGFTRFTDPKEQAFSIDVPASWKVEGGMVRKTAVDVRNYVWATSPDGTTIIRVRDPEYGFFMIPDPVHASLGVREGMNYTFAGGQLTEFVLRYIPGPDFARQYAAKLTSELHASNLQIKAVTPRQDLTKPESAAPGFQAEYTGGELEFTCTRSGQACGGKVLAATRSEWSSSPDPLTRTTVKFGHWRIPYLASYLTPQDRLGATDQIFRHMVDSVEWNSEWQRMQTRLVVNAAQANRDLIQYQDRIADEVRQKRERSEERIHQNRIDSIRGVVRLRDPDTGEELEGVAGRNYYYRSAGGRTIGTDREIRDPDFTELEQIRP